jgi:hypothetical protein
VVSQKRAEDWCQANGMPHYVVSAKDGHNVEQAFAVLVGEATERADTGPDFGDFANGSIFPGQEEPQQRPERCSNC